MTDLERLARALKAQVPIDYGMTDAEALEYVFAILTALREPSEQMMVEAYANPVKDPVDFWQAMIDSILFDIVREHS